MNIFPVGKISVGKKTYGDIYVYGYNNDNAHLDIGSYCSIAGNVEFYIGGEHPLSLLSTYPMDLKVYDVKVKNPDSSKGPIVVEDDVWIGSHCIILSGVILGQGCVIGAGSIVAKSVPPYAIYAGGKIIRYRFSPLVVEKLLRVKMSSLSEVSVGKYRKRYNTEISDSNIDEIISELVENK